MTNINIDNLLKASDTLARRVLSFQAGCISGSTRIFNACMRAFDRKVLPANEITFKVYFGYPVNSYGTATIDRQGNLTCRIDPAGE